MDVCTIFGLLCMVNTWCNQSTGRHTVAVTCSICRDYHAKNVQWKPRTVRTYICYVRTLLTV